jgi:RNA polymerase sigma-70 factor (ECF subfamily)
LKIHRNHDRLVPGRSSILVTMEAVVTAEYDSEQPVVEAIQHGDHQAFKEFLRRQDRWVRGVVFAALGNPDRVEDVVQQVWASVWQKAGELRDTRRWRSWLYRLSRNAAIDAGREASRLKQLSGRMAQDPPPRSDSDARSPAAALIDDESHRVVLLAIQSLPALYREPFVLRHLEDWSYRQISQLLELPVNTVETRLVRARRMLREALNGKV